MGHVYQSMALSALLKKTHPQIEIYFLTKSSIEIIKLIQQQGNDVVYCKDNDSIYNNLKVNNPDRVIFDNIDVSADLAKSIKQNLGLKLIIFTNLSAANKYADVTVMAGMGNDLKNGVFTDTQTGRKEFSGPRYWILRQEFEFLKKTKPIIENIENILLIFGGSDQANLSSLVLKQLLKIDKKFNITLILGASFEYREQVNSAVNNASSKSNVIIHSGSNKVAQMMYNNDLVFVSPGLSFFESLIIGTPVICFHQNDFQMKAWDGLIKTYDKNNLDIIPELIERRMFIFPNDEFIVSMDIGNGKNEIVSEIVN